jgi:hypothetical protein
MDISVRTTTPPVLRLSLVIGLLIGAVLMAVTVVTFQLVYSRGVATMDDVSGILVQRVSEAVALRLESQFGSVSTALEQLQYSVATDATANFRWTLPGDFVSQGVSAITGNATTWHDQWFDVLQIAQQSRPAGFT